MLLKFSDFSVRYYVREVTSDAIYFHQQPGTWIDRRTWTLTIGDGVHPSGKTTEYTLNSDYERQRIQQSNDTVLCPYKQVPEKQYRVEPEALRFSYDEEYNPADMLHPRLLGQEVLSAQGEKWGHVVDMEGDGYRKSDARFVFHDTHNATWAFGDANVSFVRELDETFGYQAYNDYSLTDELPEDY